MKPRTMILTAAMILAVFLITGNALCQTPLKILISNDDGVDAPGIAALAESLAKVGEVTVAAPAQNKSGVSHGITANVPIAVSKSVKNGIIWYIIDALPATCVRLSLETLLPFRPDIVVSGINQGANTGTVTFYSATVAGAREAAFLGIPSISVNLESGPGMEYKVAADFAASLVKDIKNIGLKAGSYLNVNIPALPKEKIRGVLVVPLDTRPPQEFFEKKADRDGKAYYWPKFRGLCAGDEKTDVWAINNGYISMTPLMIDQTAHKDMEHLKKWGSSLWGGAR